MRQGARKAGRALRDGHRDFVHPPITEVCYDYTARNSDSRQDASFSLIQLPGHCPLANQHSRVPVCQPGFGGAGCQECAAGTWSAGGTSANCQSCPDGKSTPSARSTSSSNCSGGGGAAAGRMVRRLLARARAMDAASLWHMHLANEARA